MGINMKMISKTSSDFLKMNETENEKRRALTASYRAKKSESIKKQMNTLLKLLVDMRGSPDSLFRSEEEEITTHFLRNQLKFKDVGIRKPEEPLNLADVWEMACELELTALQFHDFRAMVMKSGQKNAQRQEWARERHRNQVCINGQHQFVGGSSGEYVS